VLARRPLQHEADHQEATVLDHVLLDGLGRFHQVADETEQFCAANRHVTTTQFCINFLIFDDIKLKGE